ncbi:uncharacterized protein LOC129875857 [Solanum dulcamara]|uniref:uncharacterized protein LOC129875857 n=1 Tax=Solanum dulcamara TaxID=45834 RepID=UPI002486A072|nr:uncharacterized protein LOC129875857 [Solanum dulcamara]
MANIRASKKMNEKKKVPQRGLGVAQLERIRLEEQHKKDSIFQKFQCPKFIPTSSRIDFSSKDCVFRPNQSAPFLENCSKLWSGEYSQDVNQKVHHHGVVFGHNLNLPSVLQQRGQQYQKTSSSTSIVNISSEISSSSSSVQNLQMEPPSNQSHSGCKCLPLCPEEVKTAGVKRPYPFSQECLPVPSFRCKLPECCVGPVSRSHEAASSSDECSVNVEEGNVLKREVVSKSRALSESEPSVSVRETKGLNGDFLRLAPPAAALPHLEAVNRRSLTDSAPQCLQLLDYVPSRVDAAEHKPPSGLSISVQQPILRFSPSAKVQMNREGTRGSDFQTEVGGNVDLELKL